MKQSTRMILSLGMLMALLVAGTVLAFSRRNVTVYEGPLALAEFTEHDVKVQISLIKQDAAWLLTATYTPLREGFHLYGKDIPVTGIDGVGRPTRLDFVSATGVTAIGTVSADKPTQESIQEGASKPLIVYPPGAVTLRQPVTLNSDGTVKATLAITYMACSDVGLCLPPVEAREVEITIRS